MAIDKNPSWILAVQIGLGILVIIISIFILAHTGKAFVSLIWILGIVLLFVGIERIIVGLVSSGRSRWANIGLGILVMILGGIATAYPVATGYFIIYLLGFALLFSGIARIIDGFSSKHSGSKKAFIIGVGILAVILSIAVLVSPVFGAQLAGFIIAIGLLITGIQMVIAGVQGKQFNIMGKNISR